MYYLTGDGSKNGVQELLLDKTEKVWKSVQAMLNKKEEKNQTVDKKDIEGSVATASNTMPELKKFTGLTKEKANELDPAQLFGMLPVALRKVILTPATTKVKVAPSLTEERVQEAIRARLKYWIPKAYSGSPNYRKQGNYAADNLLKQVGSRMPKRGGEFSKSKIAGHLIKKAGESKASEIISNFEKTTNRLVAEKEAFLKRPKVKDVAKEEKRQRQTKVIREHMIKQFKDGKKSYMWQAKYFEGAYNQWKYAYNKSYKIESLEDFGKEGSKSVKVKVGEGSYTNDPDDMGKTKKVPYIQFYNNTGFQIELDQDEKELFYV